MELLELTSSQLQTFDFARGFGMYTLGSEEIRKAVDDLKPCLGSALVAGGLAVMHHGYERYTNDVDILYAYSDSDILKRLSSKFKRVKKAKSGWHKFEHRKTGVRLELVPEGVLTTYGIIPGPHLFESDNGFLPLWGLVWLKLVSGRAKDDADITELAHRRLNDVIATRQKLPSELHERFDALIARTKREIETDPNNGPAEDEEEEN
jgi:hypothetical protein